MPLGEVHMRAVAWRDRAVWFVACAALAASSGCASGEETGRSRDSGMDARVGDGGETRPDTGPIERPDAAPIDGGRGAARTCEACTMNDDCDVGFWCAELGVGGRACLPVCELDIPSCPARFDCVMSFSMSIPDPVCAPVGERCCVDGDGDLHGEGIGCLGVDCDDADGEVHSSAGETCDGTDEDCDGVFDEGDPGVLCPRGTHVAGTACAAGTCTIAACEPAFGDCNGDPADGCETSLETPTTCGACDVACSLPHATPACESGTCRVATCDAGWGDCNGDPADGCETSLTSPTHCGGCGVTCARANSTTTCDTGTCAIATCDPNWGNCDGASPNGCETPLVSNAHCGTCGTICAPSGGTGECSTGTCRVSTCAAGFQDCDMSTANGCETSIRSLANCGDCGVACAFPQGTASCSVGACTLTGCDPGHGNCDGLTGNGCETPLDTTSSCGACGAVCAPPNASGACGTGTCTIAACNSGWADCDGSVLNGCETSTRTTTSCGACGTLCTRANATADCASGTCAIGFCNPGWADCNGIDADGCETSLRTTASCGACGTTCTREHATPTCSTGACAIQSCELGWGNCDSFDANGCETSLRTTTSCGGCGTLCTRANATTDCASGTCAIDACDPGFGNCDGNGANGCERALDTLTSCGTCGTPCTRANATATCSGGTCAIASCNPGWGNCDGNDANGCERPLNTVGDCGGCGVVCSRANAAASCGAGVCTIAACSAGYGNCDSVDGNGCETSLRTTSSCGACGVACSPAGGAGDCSTGSCQIATCAAGFADCDTMSSNGCETSIRTLTDCGACDTACTRPNASAACATGSCSIASCNAGFANCDMLDSNGCEQPLSSLTHCGACGTVCARPNATASCGSGACSIVSCDAGYGSCDSLDANGCEQSLSTLTHCGGCAVACTRANATATCGTGTCAIAWCNAGWADCDGNDANGCEQRLDTLSHCGACGTACTRANASATCSTGACAIASCNAGYGNCDGNQVNGCEQSLTSLNHCGGCGTTCSRPNASATCTTGTCALSTCNSRYSNCDGNATNGCELSHAAVAGTCAGAPFVGTYDGDRSCGFICGGNTDWNVFQTRSGQTSAWFRARVFEDSTCSASIEHRIRLTSPPGMDYDLYVYRACGSGAVGSSALGGASVDEVIVSQGDNSGDDSFDYWVEVRYWGGQACGSWSLELAGHDC